jgi:outer membrane protein
MRFFPLSAACLSCLGFGALHADEWPPAALTHPGSALPAFRTAPDGEAGPIIHATHTKEAAPAVKATPGDNSPVAAVPLRSVDKARANHPARAADSLHKVPDTPPPQPHASPEAPRPLTLPEAHQIALRKHPKISVSRLLALASWQGVDEARSGFFPQLSLNVAGVGTARENTRSVSSTLPVSSVADRGGAAVYFSQLVTDFGRTWNLTASTILKARADDRNVDATRAQILLEVDNAYFATLRGQALLHVAQDTVRERRILRDQVDALAKNDLRSSLDVSFADVSLQQAELLLSRTENDLASSSATLAALLDEGGVTEYRLADQSHAAAPEGNVHDLISAAFQNRPELLSLGLQRDSAAKFARAEHALKYPRVTAEAIAGELPYHDSATNENYAAFGVEVNVPLFNGKLFTAKAREADLRAQAGDAALHDARNDVERDVRIAWLAANNAYKNLAITTNLRQQAKRSLDLAQARYNAGTSGMVELSQAQLALTAADIDETSARYEYLLRLSILSFQTGMLK